MMKRIAAAVVGVVALGAGGAAATAPPPGLTSDAQCTDVETVVTISGLEADLSGVLVVRFLDGDVPVGEARSDRVVILAQVTNRFVVPTPVDVADRWRQATDPACALDTEELTPASQAELASVTTTTVERALLFAYPSELLADGSPVCSAETAGDSAVLSYPRGEGEPLEVPIVCSDLDGEWSWALELDHVPTVETRQAVLACVREWNDERLFRRETGSACDEAMDLLEIEGGPAAELVQLQFRDAATQWLLTDPGPLEPLETRVLTTEFEQAISDAVYTGTLMENYATAASPPA